MTNEINEFNATDWYRKIVTEKSVSLADFIESRREKMLSDLSSEREEAAEEISAVLTLFPSNFLSKEEVEFLLKYFINTLQSSALTGGHSIKVIHFLVLKCENLPENSEGIIFDCLFKEGNLQSWPQSDRFLQYEILQWFLKKKSKYVRALGAEFLRTFIKSVSGEKDPRCLLQMFSIFLQVCKTVPFGPYTEDMFEIVACYFPIEFKPSPKDSVSREYLAAACAACLVASPTFAPFCYLFIDEKLNNDECSDEEYTDILELLIMACETFPPQKNAHHIEPLLTGIRKLVLDPNRKGTELKNTWTSFEAVVNLCREYETSPVMDAIVESIIDNSEPFVLQSEMGLTGVALKYLLHAYQCLSKNHRRPIWDRVITWILSLVKCDGVRGADNKKIVMEESLVYLVQWIQAAAQNDEILSLSAFESSIFDSCALAREVTPEKALISTYESALVYIHKKCASPALVSQCQENIEKSVCTPVNAESFDNLLKLIRVFTEENVEQMRTVLATIPTTEWCSAKVLPILCAMSCSSLGWKLVKKEMEEELENVMTNSSIIGNLNHYVMMMKHNKGEQMAEEQLELFVDILDKVDGIDIRVSETIQSITCLLSPQEHQIFMDRITSKFKVGREENIDSIAQKYTLAFLQNAKADDLREVSSLVSSEHIAHQMMFAACNRNNELFQGLPEVAVLKANMLRNTPNLGLKIESFLLGATKKDDFEFLFNFDTADTNPEKCLYRTDGPFWRQRIFCQFLHYFKKSFEEVSNERKNILCQILPYLLKFAAPLDYSRLKAEYASLTPVLIQSLRFSALSEILCSIPLLLRASESIDNKNMHTIINFLGSILRNEESSTEDVIHALDSLHILAQQQNFQCLLPDVSFVVSSINKILGHKKRSVRVLSATVKNNWEMQAIR